MVAARRGVTMAPEEKQHILCEMRRLPLHPEVPEALARLRQAGLRLVALTNSTAQVAEARLAHAGLSGSFEYIFSADAVQRLKPASEPYQMVAERLGVATGDLRMIAAHAWDIAGALRVGCAAAFVARPGMVLDPLVDPRMSSEPICARSPNAFSNVRTGRCLPEKCSPDYRTPPGSGLYFGQNGLSR
jgi:2-haloacid dehalogenase